MTSLALLGSFERRHILGTLSPHILLLLHCRLLVNRSVEVTDNLNLLGSF